MSPTRPRKVPLGITLLLCSALLFLIAPFARATATADIEVTKTNDTGGTLAAGGTVTYTITVTNHGPSGASQVVIEDDLDSHLTNAVIDAVTQPSQCSTAGTPIVITCQMQGLGASGSVNTIVFHATVDPSTPADTVITNCPFEKSSNSTDPDHTNDSAPHSCDGAGFTVVVQADLSVTKTQTTPDPTVEPVVPGATNVTYHISATNNGGSDATNFVLDEKLTDGSALYEGIANATTGLDCATNNTNTVGSAFVEFTCVKPTLANGASVSFDLTLQMPNDGTQSITNQASVSSDTDDPNTDNNTSSVTTDICQSVDLAITKVCSALCSPPVASPIKPSRVVGKDTVLPTCPSPITEIQGGSEFEYIITVTNNDSSVNTTNVLLSDALPAGVSYVSDTASCTSGSIAANNCNLGSLDPGASVSFSITVKAIESGPVDNSASVSSDRCDRNTADNTSDCQITVDTNNMPTALEVDREPCANVGSPFCTGDSDSVATDSDHNRVFEPGETVRVDPAWTNTLDNADSDETGTASSLTGPGDGTLATYTILDSTADYGAIPAHAQSDCNGVTATSPDSTGTGDCYGMQIVQTSGTRPHLSDHPVHWDATFVETLNSGEVKTWQMHIGNSFSDVPHGDIFYRAVETIFHNHITVGCGDATIFCPSNFTTRQEMAAFVDRSILGRDSLVPSEEPGDGSIYNCTDSGGLSQFDDVPPATAGFCRHINYLKFIKLTGGCFDTSHFCPTDNVTRGQIAVFVAGGMEINLGNSADPLGSVPLWKQSADLTREYNCTGSDQTDPDTSNVIPANTAPFLDVSTSDNRCPFVGFLFVNHVVSGDGAGHYFPDSDVKRDETAAILSNAFVAIPLYGPAVF